MQRAPSGSPLNRWRQCSLCSFLVSTIPKHLLSSVLQAIHSCGSNIRWHQQHASRAGTKLSCWMV